MTYPPTTIKSTDNIVNILQLTDSHLHFDLSTKITGHSCQKTFDDCLNQALSEDIRCDLILLTGDLVNEVRAEIYDRIFAILDKTDIPYACIAGNHDVTDEVGAHLAFHERKLVPHMPDPRLLSCHCIEANNWKLLLLDSSIPGKVSGEITPQTLTWLKQTLATTSSPVLIALHHHVTPMASKWLDKHIAKNTDSFWSVIEQYSHVKTVITGHVHQEQTYIYKDVTVYATPSTCFQFSPHQDDFALDPVSKPGYRWVQLNSNSEVTSWVNRLID